MLIVLRRINALVPDCILSGYRSKYLVVALQHVSVINRARFPPRNYTLHVTMRYGQTFIVYSQNLFHKGMARMPIRTFNHSAVL